MIEPAWASNPDSPITVYSQAARTATLPTAPPRQTRLESSDAEYLGRVRPMFPLYADDVHEVLPGTFPVDRPIQISGAVSLSAGCT